MGISIVPSSGGLGGFGRPPPPGIFFGAVGAADAEGAGLIGSTAADEIGVSLAVGGGGGGAVSVTEGVLDALSGATGVGGSCELMTIHVIKIAAATKPTASTLTMRLRREPLSNSGGASKAGSSAAPKVPAVRADCAAAA